MRKGLRLLWMGMAKGGMGSEVWLESPSLRSPVMVSDAPLAVLNWYSPLTWSWASERPGRSSTDAGAGRGGLRTGNTTVSPLPGGAARLQLAGSDHLTVDPAPVQVSVTAALTWAAPSRGSRSGSARGSSRRRRDGITRLRMKTESAQRPR